MTPAKFFRTAVVVGVATALSGPLAAQVTGRVSLSGGQATDSRGASSGAWTVAPSLVVAPSPFAALRLGASGTRFVTGGWSVGGSAGLGGRVELGPVLGLAFDAVGSVTTTSYRANYAEADATPALTAKIGAATLFGGAHVGAGRSAGFVVPSTGPFSPPASAVARTAAGPLFGARLVLAPSRSMALVLGYREQHDRIAGISVTDRSASLAVTASPLTVEGVLGARRAPDELTTLAALRLELAISPLVALEAGAERYPSDRLTGTPGGKALHAGLSLRFGGPRGQPMPSGVAPVSPGRVRLAISAPDASHVELGGDWNGWRLEPATRAPDGVWYVDLRLSPGQYRYAFRIDDHRWQVPHGSAAVDDGFGGRTATLVVPSTTH